MTDVDHLLTHKALAKIVNAQGRGTLSDRIFIRRLPTQIVLEQTTSKDREWITKNFPGSIADRDGFSVRRQGRSGQRYEEVHYVAPLREEDPKQPWRAPRLEVWGIQVPHVCRNFNGSASDKGVKWKCSAYHCGKVLTKTKARELGLLPERTR